MGQTWAGRASTDGASWSVWVSLAEGPVLYDSTTKFAETTPTFQAHSAKVSFSHVFHNT